MSNKTRLRVAVLPLSTALLLAGCSDYASIPTDTVEGPSGAGGSVGVAGASGSPAAGTTSISTGSPSTEGNPTVAGIAGAASVGAGTGGAATTATNDAGVPAGDPGTVVPRGAGPCDLYAAGNAPCVAAYSMVRALSSTYDGPLYQVRRGAPNPTQNTGVGGETQDIGILTNGFADAAAQDAFCGDQACSVSIVYDQSGRGNNVTVAKRGLAAGGDFADEDDFESNAKAGRLTVGGNDVYSLFMEVRQGYRQTVAGDGMPRGRAPQGIYMLADGTRAGTFCCWDFGSVTPDPTVYRTMNTLNFGTVFWGQGAGNGPWFGADFEGGIWAAGTRGSLDQNNPVPFDTNPNSPSLRVPFALGILKTNDNYALRMANVQTATDLTTAWDGPLPKPMDNQGAVVIGVGGDNSNNSFGTFFEGAIVSGYPSDAVELAVLQNIQAAGYGQ
jgi:hypothetical protein